MKNADVPHLEVGVKNLALGEGRGGGKEPLKSRWAMCGKCLETITLFRSKICDLFYPVSGLTQNLTPLIKTVPKRIATT